MGVKVIDTSILYSTEDIDKSVVVRSYVDYVKRGGRKDILDVYAQIKNNAKKVESDYIQCCDMLYSGIPVENTTIKHKRLMSQALWYIIHLWFDKPLRQVSYQTFDLDEFNNL